tara:strand:- start:548 stop:889 length:342 start_codon:yes stop_codon:yes gene_type:complete
MKIEKKSLTIGVLIGFCGTLFLSYFLGNVDTKFEIKTGHDKVISDFAKSIDVKLEKIVKNDLEKTNIFVTAKGNVSKTDIDQELDKIFKSNNIDKNDPNLNIEIRINNYYNIY